MAFLQYYCIYWKKIVNKIKYVAFIKLGLEYSELYHNIYVFISFF